MSYIEMGNVLFRGELRGARGRIKGKLTANAVNVIDTIHIADGQITFSVFSAYYNRQITPNAVVHSIQVDIPDAQGFVEVTAFCDYGASASANTSTNSAYVRIDGGMRIGTNGSRPWLQVFPFNETVALARGVHTIEIVSGNHSLLSGKGYILARYIRATGSANR